MKKVALGGAVAVMALAAFFSFQGRLFSQAKPNRVEAQARPSDKVAAQDDDNLLFEDLIDLKAQPEETKKFLNEKRGIIFTPQQIQIMSEATGGLCPRRRPGSNSNSVTGGAPRIDRCRMQSCHAVCCVVVLSPSGDSVNCMCC